MRIIPLTGAIKHAAYDERNKSASWQFHDSSCVGVILIGAKESRTKSSNMALNTFIISMFMLMVLVIIVQASNSLKNNPFIFKCYSDCSRYGCRKAKDVRDNCPGGTVYGVCGCCLRCAKLEGEECGDYKNMKGICDVGLYCHVKKRNLYKFASGICRSKFM